MVHAALTSPNVPVVPARSRAPRTASPRRLLRAASVLICASIAACSSWRTDTEDLEDSQSGALEGDEDEEMDDDSGPLPSAALAAAEALSPSPSSSLSALAPAPRLSVVFTAPKGQGDADLTLENEVIELANHATSGSKVRVSMFHWDRTKVAEAFVAAAKRGVDVRIVIDSDNEKNGDFNEAVKLLRTGLGSNLTICQRGKGACIGSKINHNKFFLFSALDDGSTNVVGQASQNLTGHQLVLHNNMVVARNDPALFAAYEGYFADLVDQKLDLNYDRTLDGDDVRAFTFPRSGADKVASVLDNVQCTAGSKIRIAMAYFSNRPEVAAKLTELQKAGCQVSMVVRASGAGTGKKIMKTLKAGGVDVSVFPTASGNGNHSKYLLIDAPFEGSGGTARRKLVFTGSHNYTKAALRMNDEILLRVEDPGVYGAFLDNWKLMKGQSQ
jgi:hypothetical protein